MGHLELAKHPQFWQQLENSLGKLTLVDVLVTFLLMLKDTMTKMTNIKESIELGFAYRFSEV